MYLYISSCDFLSGRVHLGLWRTLCAPHPGSLELSGSHSSLARTLGLAVGEGAGLRDRN